MPMVRCPIHELQFVPISCEHISGAVATKRREQVYFLVDGWGSPVALCHSCRDRARTMLLAERAKMAPDKGYDLEWGTDSGGYCVRCMGEWFAEQGQGDLDEKVAEAIRSAGFVPS